MKKTLSSPLVAAANNIVSLGSRSNSLPRFQRDFNSFSRFLEVENRSLEKLKLPDKKKIRALASLNIASNFGRPGNLLGSLFSGALDLAGFVGNMFPGRGKMGKPQRPSNVKPPKPTIRGPKLKLGGMRAVGVGNALFAGLDFATGLAEGESVGKAAAGAGGALAGSLLGGAIGQALIPIPGLGFVVGSMAGSFLGGYTADRVYEGGSALKQKLAERLKGQEGKQKGIASGLTFKDTIDKFDAAISRFEKGVAMGMFGSITQQAAGSESEFTDSDIIEPDYSIDTGNGPQATGVQLEDVEASGGEVPGSPNSGFKTSRRPNHNGNDYFKSAGTPISLIQEGTVTVADMNYDPGGWGALIEVRHKDGSLSRYAHMSRISVAPGSKVSPGQVIGYTGGEAGAPGSGNSEGPHLHFEYLPAGSGQIDPTQAAKQIFRFGGNVKVKSVKSNGISPGGQMQQMTPQQGQQNPAGTLQSQSQQVTPTPQPTPAASPQMMQVPQMSSMVAAAPMNLPVQPQNIQYYTSYNQPGGGASVIMPIMMGGGGGGQQRPVFIPVGGGGGGGTVIMPGPTEGQVVNSLMKTMLLTNLSAT
jgi:murein DD-endopeptidase MepM/ murein hydrolase activator NlpD